MTDSFEMGVVQPFTGWEEKIKGLDRVDMRCTGKMDCACSALSLPETEED